MKRNLWAKLLLTFFSILEPFNKLLHLLQEDTLSFCKMCIFIPLQDGFFAQNFSCKVYKSDVNRAKHQIAVSKEPCLAGLASSPRNFNTYLLVVPWGWLDISVEKRTTLFRLVTGGFLSVASRSCTFTPNGNTAFSISQLFEFTYSESVNH